MKDRKTSAKTKGSVDEFLRSVYDSLSVKVLAEAAANAPPLEDDDLDAIDASIAKVAPRRIDRAEKRRARS